MLKDLQRLREQARELNRKRIDIVAEGQYPDKRGTKVADVAVYQNEGTEKITPAKFVEAAEGSNEWSESIGKAAKEFLNSNEGALTDLGLEVSHDIGVACNRIRTGRLKKSFRPVIKQK